MTWNESGCEICKLAARADRRRDALFTIACAKGPEFLNQCTFCGAYWRETLRFEEALTHAAAVKQFGEVDGRVDFRLRLVELLSEWSRWGRNQTVYVQEPWSADANAILLTVLPDETTPIVRDGNAFAYFLEAEIATDFLQDYLQGRPADISLRALAERLVIYAETDA